MAINPVATGASASTAQSDAIVAQARAKAANQQTLVNERSEEKEANPVFQAPARPVVNTNGENIGTKINVTA